MAKYFSEKIPEMLEEDTPWVVMFLWGACLASGYDDSYTREAIEAGNNFCALAYLYVTPITYLPASPP